MVRRVFSLVYKEVRGLHQAAYILALFAFGSQILAIVRDRLLAHTFGAGAELDLYYAAFRIPDLLFVLFASVLSIYVLLPFVNKATEENGDKAGSEVLSQVFSLFLIVYSVVALMLIISAPLYTEHIFPGLGDDSLTLVTMMQIMLLQPFLLGISTLCGVVTQMNHRFVLYALSPLLYNFGIILGIVYLFPIFGLNGLAYGVVLGAFGHLLIQVPFVFKSNFSFRPILNINWKLICSILAVSIPRALTLSVNQIVLLVFVSMATLMTAGSVSTFQFAFNLQSVPLAIIGMSYSVAAFPTLSSMYAKSDKAGFNRQLITAMRHIIFWSLPIIGLVIVLRAQIVRVLLGSGEFDWSDTRLTAALLAIFVFSLFAQAILLLLVRAFYAGGKTVTPLLIALVSASFSIISAFYFRDLFATSVEFQNYINGVFRLIDVPGTEVIVLAIAFVIGQLLQLFILMIVSVGTFSIDYSSLKILFVQAFFASIVGVFFSYCTLTFIVGGVNQDTFLGVALQGLVAGVVGLSAVIGVYYFFHSQELHEIHKSFRARIFKTDVIEPEEGVL